MNLTKAMEAALDDLKTGIADSRKAGLTDESIYQAFMLVYTGEETDENSGSYPESGSAPKLRNKIPIHSLH